MRNLKLAAGGEADQATEKGMTSVGSVHATNLQGGTMGNERLPLGLERSMPVSDAGDSYRDYAYSHATASKRSWCSNNALRLPGTRNPLSSTVNNAIALFFGERDLTGIPFFLVCQHLHSRLADDMRDIMGFVAGRRPGCPFRLVQRIASRQTMIKIRNLTVTQNLTAPSDTQFWHITSSSCLQLCYYD
jgi:hypothetical protein